MRGIRIMMFARRAFREDTLALMVYPAIADLQFEAATGSLSTLVRGYAAVARAVYGGLVHDFCTDLRVLYGDAPDLLRAVAMQACYYAMMLTLCLAVVAAAAIVIVLWQQKERRGPLRFDAQDDGALETLGLSEASF